MSTNTKPVLSISILISSNRAETIEKCMKALIPLREAVPCELIIVDTGCKDEGAEIAAKYADKMISFTWCNDFAAARNAGLKECTGEWFLYMDDDEWFDDVSELISFFQSKDRDKYDALWYVVRNYDDYAGIAYTDTFVGRVVKLTPQSKFHGKIHEWIEPFPTKTKRVSTFAHHYGYVYKNEEERQKHLARNIVLEEAAVAERPEDVRMCCQLVQEYRAADREDDAEALCKKVLRETKYEKTNSFVQYLLVTLPKIYREQKRFEDAEKEFARLEQEEPLLHQTKRTLYFERAVLYGQMQEQAKVAGECRKYFEELKELPKVGDPVEYEVMDFAHYTSDASKRKMVLFGILAVVYGKVYEDAEYFFDKVDWAVNKPYPFEQLDNLFTVYRESGNGELLQKYIPRIVAQKEMETRVYGGLHNLYASHSDIRQKLLEDLEPLGLRSGNLAYFHLLYLAQKNALTPEDVTEYFEKSDRKYDAETMVLLFTKPEPLSVALGYISWEQYREAVEMFVKDVTDENSEALISGFLDCEAVYAEGRRSFFLYGKFLLADRLLRLYAAQGQAEGGVKDVEQVDFLLRQTVGAATEFCEYLYHPQILAEQGWSALPRNYRFAYQLKKAFENEGNFSVWADAVKEAAKTCPELLPVLKVLLASKDTKKKQQSAETELMQLAAQLKSMVSAQLAEGKTEEAKAILSELAMMLPEDEEVKELLQKA